MALRFPLPRFLAFPLLGQVVYRGYVDDPRNTDNAWLETTAFHFHCPAKLGELLVTSYKLQVTSYKTTAFHFHCPAKLGEMLSPLPSLVTCNL